MADDDLEAFFDDVSAVEAEVKQELVNGESRESATNKEEDKDMQPPPAKKQKVDTRKPPKRPLGVVVASSSSVVSSRVSPAPASVATPAQPSATTVLPSPASLPSPSIATTTATTVGPQPPLPPGPLPSSSGNNSKGKPHQRSAAGKVWVDVSLDEWPENDYRLFVGNIPKDVSDQALYEHFTKYPSLAMVKIVRDAEGTSKGYGFVSLLEPMECARAIREMDQTWLSSRPIRVKRSDWKDRELKSVRQKKKKLSKKQKRMGF